MPEFAPLISLAALDGTNGFRLDGIDASDLSGRCVAGAGDVNGDGFSDILIGARQADASGDGDAGESYVVFGKSSSFGASFDLSTLDGSNGFRVDGVDASDRSGRSVAAAGDVNGDGFDDILIGAMNADPGGDGDAGESYVVFGKATAFAATFELSGLDGSNGFRLDGIDPGDLSGFPVAAAGDINGDGFGDILIGAFRADPGGNADAGESYVVFGKALGFSATLDLSTLNGSNGFRLDGLDPLDRSGQTIASAGDINGDGFDDILVGALSGDPDDVYDSGETYVVFGKAAGFTATFDLASLNGANGFRLDGIDPRDFSGYPVASAGDVNGDGFDDILIGAYFSDPGGNSYAGESYLVFGKASGFSATVDLASLDGVNGFRLDGIEGGDFSGRSVSSAGDVNGDGFDDILIGAFGAQPDGDSYAGESYVVFGKGSAFGASLSLATLDGDNGFRLAGIDVDDLSGFSAATAGDINGDGFDDIVIGASGGDPGGDGDAGESYVVFGHRASTSVVRVGTGIAQTMNGGFGADTIDGLGGNDTLIGWESADTIDGGLGNDIIEGGTGNDTIDGGIGNDELGGGSGADSMSGGAGSDTYAVDLVGDKVIEAHGEGIDTVEVSANVGKYTLAANVERLVFLGLGNFVGRGNELANMLTGADGADRFIVDAGGADRFIGGLGTDTMDFRTATTGASINVATGVHGGSAAGDTYSSIDVFFGSSIAADALTGSASANRFEGFGGNDTLAGSGGNDSLFGGDGRDEIVGGDGRDTSSGGAGDDDFNYTSIAQSGTDGATRDRILDFVHLADDIDASAIDARAGAMGNNGFSFRAQAAFTAEGQIRAFQLGANTIVEFNVSGTSKAEMSIQLNNFAAMSLTVADFIL